MDVEPYSRRARSFERLARRVLGVLGAAVGLLGCAQEVDVPLPRRSPAGSGVMDTGPPPDPAGCIPGTPSRVRRLSQGEYQRSVRTLLGVEPAMLSWSAPDPLVHGFDNNGEALAVSPGNYEDFALAAELTAALVDVSTLAPCNPALAHELDGCVQTFVASLAARAYGRSVTSDEVERLHAQYRLGARLENHEAGIRLVVETVLVSPHFLYRVEIGSSTKDQPAVRTFDAFETANALSFALTGARPDAVLVARAASDQGRDESHGRVGQ